jgi:hypothetical protein
MSAPAVMLVAVGLADACRRLTRLLWPPLLVAPVVVVACALLAGLWHLGDLPLLLIAAAAGVGWILLCARAERAGEHEGAPLALFFIAACLLIVLSGWGSHVAGVMADWPTWAHLRAIKPDRLLMVIGVGLAQFVTGNQLVRLVLGSVGVIKPAGEPQPSDRLKGGRLSQ